MTLQSVPTATVYVSSNIALLKLTGEQMIHTSIELVLSGTEKSKTYHYIYPDNNLHSKYFTVKFL